jgi:prepilin-type N-terminal cleavage/methylation domain-containing protein
VRNERRLPGATPSPWRSICRTPRVREDQGFTLIELVIVSLILPIIIGAMTLSLIAIFSTDGSVSGRLQGSGDAQVISANYEKDVQSAALVTSDNAPSTGPGPCETSAEATNSLVTQVLGLQLGSGQTGVMQTEISYVEVPESGNHYSLFRNSCQIGSTIPITAVAISNNVASGLAATITCDATLTSALVSGTSYTTLNVSSLPDTVSATGTPDQITISTGGSPATVATFTASSAASTGAHAISVTARTPSSNFPVGSQVVDSSWATRDNCGANAGWVGTTSLTGVTLPVSELGSSPSQPYRLTALPGASSPASGQTPVVTPNSSCGFATPGTGTYASSLCFVDFTPYSATPVACPGFTGYQVISAPIANTPYTLTFCLQVTGTTVTPHIIPTYFAPPTSEAFLGNNGFYTGIPGNPALYQTGGGTTTVSVVNIQVLDSNNNPATGWELVTGDAESTDAGEWMTWSTSLPSATAPAPVLNLLPNSPTSQIGNACADPTSPDGLTNIGTTTVKCAASVSSDKTGTVMLEASAPTQLTVSMYGSGLEAMFLGLLLP